MSLIDRVLLRLGCIRLSRYGLQIGPEGRLQPMAGLGSDLDLSFSEVPAGRIDPLALLGSTEAMAPRALPPGHQPLRDFVPRDATPQMAATPNVPSGVAATSPLASPGPRSPRPPMGPPPVPGLSAGRASQVSRSAASVSSPTQTEAAIRPATNDSEAGNVNASSPSDEERLWQEALARANGQSSDADEPVPAAASSSLASPVASPDSIEGDPSEEAWDALMAQARARAEKAEEQTVAEEKTSTVAAIQIEADAVAANDALPADEVTSIHYKRVAPLSVAQAEDDAWQAQRRRIEAEQQAEAHRKERAIREIQRLQQGQRARPSFLPASTRLPKAPRRLAKGTASAPVAHPPADVAPAFSDQDETQVRDPVVTPARSEAAPLPRITQRLARHS